MKVTLTDEALLDIQRLGTWLIEKNPTAAFKAIAAIRKSVGSLDRFAERGYPMGDGVRHLRVPFGKRGYVVRYEVTPDEVVVSRIFHGLEDR